MPLRSGALARVTGTAWWRMLPQETHAEIQRFVDMESTGRVSIDFVEGRPRNVEIRTSRRITTSNDLPDGITL